MRAERFPISSLAISLALFVSTFQAFAQTEKEDLSVLDGWMRFTDARNAQYHHLASEALEQLRTRAKRVAKLNSQEEWVSYRQSVRDTLQELIGPFPTKTALNPRLTGTLEKESYRIEKLIFESTPGVLITAALFLPRERQVPAPAILFCSGHNEAAFRSTVYQAMILNLVGKGFIVLAFDPIGQGERLQYLDPGTGESAVGGPTKEHSYPGAQTFLLGFSLARQMVWDGIRCVDYLLSRPEVDSSRIGITGRSGGGTQTALIAAIDDRLAAAAPECYITTFERLLESDGPQDAEQNLFRGFLRGIDLPDLLIARAPKPVLILGTTRDFFSIQGVREAFREVSKAYSSLGASDQAQLSEDDAPHASTQKNREAMYAFFQKAFGLKGSSADKECDLLEPSELRVTPTGQVVSSYGSQTVFDLIGEEAVRQRTTRAEVREGLVEFHKNLPRTVAEISGYKPPLSVSEPVFRGRFQRPGYSVERYFAATEGDYVLPYLLMIPDGTGPHPGLIYLHPRGKQAESAPSQEMEALVRQGFAVMAPDLLGTGEIGPGDFTGDAFSFKVGQGGYNIWFLALQTGRSLVGVQAADLNRLARILTERSDIQKKNLTAVARETMGPVLLHAAIQETTIANLAVINSVTSQQDLVETRYYAPELIHATVAGALSAYDLPDLVGALAPRACLILNPVNGRNLPISRSEATEQYALSKRDYSDANSTEKLSILARRKDSKAAQDLRDWLVNLRISR